MPSIPANALVRSAARPAGPVTKVCMPSGAASATVSRSSFTASFTSPDESMGAMNWTALPSSDGMGPITALPSPSPSSSVFSAAASPSWAGVNASAFSMTMTAGTSLESRNFACQSCAAVASALAGRKEAWSFDETSSSRPNVGPPMPAMASQVRTSSTGRSQRSQNGTRALCWGLVFMIPSGFGMGSGTIDSIIEYLHHGDKCDMGIPYRKASARQRWSNIRQGTGKRSAPSQRTTSASRGGGT